MGAGLWKARPSTATVAQRPRARRAAVSPAAKFICDISQPPKMSPAGLVSAGMAIGRMAALRRSRVGPDMTQLPWAGWTSTAIQRRRSKSFGSLLLVLNGAPFSRVVAGLGVASHRAYIMYCPPLMERVDPVM